ncbi:hypothetical protein GGR50DRAFT_691865 [Xylaria sp. CBS 124048]|nr:hypothetical protein GGR50DRAFT_691865 [Xylaria sp. CBS 124048]
MSHRRPPRSRHGARTSRVQLQEPHVPHRHRNPIDGDGEMFRVVMDELLSDPNITDDQSRAWRGSSRAGGFMEVQYSDGVYPHDSSVLSGLVMPGSAIPGTVFSGSQRSYGLPYQAHNDTLPHVGFQESAWQSSSMNRYPPTSAEGYEVLMSSAVFSPTDGDSMALYKTSNDQFGSSSSSGHYPTQNYAPSATQERGAEVHTRRRLRRMSTQAFQGSDEDLPNTGDYAVAQMPMNQSGRIQEEPDSNSSSDGETQSFRNQFVHGCMNDGDAPWSPGYSRQVTGNRHRY